MKIANKFQSFAGAAMISLAAALPFAAAAGEPAKTTPVAANTNRLVSVTQAANTQNSAKPLITVKEPAPHRSGSVRVFNLSTEHPETVESVAVGESMHDAPRSVTKAEFSVVTEMAHVKKVRETVMDWAQSAKRNVTILVGPENNGKIKIFASGARWPDEINAKESLRYTLLEHLTAAKETVDEVDAQRVTMNRPSGKNLAIAASTPVVGP